MLHCYAQNYILIQLNMLVFLEKLLYFQPLATLCQSWCSSCAALWSHSLPIKLGSCTQPWTQGSECGCGLGVRDLEWELCYMHTNLLSQRWIPKAGWSVHGTDFSVKAEKYYSNFVRLYISSFRIFDWIPDFDILSFLISLTLSFHGSSVASIIISTLILHPDITSPILWRYLAELYFLLPSPPSNPVLFWCNLTVKQIQLSSLCSKLSDPLIYSEPVFSCLWKWNLTLCSWNVFVDHLLFKMGLNRIPALFLLCSLPPLFP